MTEDQAKAVEATATGAIKSAIGSMLPADAKVVVNVSVRVYVATGSSNVDFPKDNESAES